MNTLTHLFRLLMVFQVSSHELEAYNGDGIPQVVHDTKYQLSDLLPGRNYSISVVALSQGIPSEPTYIYQATSKFILKT